MYSPTGCLKLATVSSCMTSLLRDRVGRDVHEKSVDGGVCTVCVYVCVCVLSCVYSELHSRTLQRWVQKCRKHNTDAKAATPLQTQPHAVYFSLLAMSGVSIPFFDYTPGCNVPSPHLDLFSLHYVNPDFSRDTLSDRCPHLISQIQRVCLQVRHFVTDSLPTRLQACCWLLACPPVCCQTFPCPPTWVLPYLPLSTYRPVSDPMPVQSNSQLLNHCLWL